jgi:NarL family two-component system response regulator LiaR
MVRVLICDDQRVVCEGLEMILSADPEIEVVATAQDGAEALSLIPDNLPDVVLMDLKMPGMNGIQATREISRLYPQIKVLVLTTYGEDDWVFDAVRSGAAGYLLKGTPRASLVAAVKGTAAGDAYIDPAVGGKLLTQVASSAPQPETTLAAELSDRELEVLKLLAHGLTNAEIAERLYLTRGTVRNYISSLLSKLGVEDRTQAALIALRHGLVDRGES